MDLSFGDDVTYRLVPFVFNESQAYQLVFFLHTDGQYRMVIADGNGLITWPNSLPVYCPDTIQDMFAHTGPATHTLDTDIGSISDIVVDFYPAIGSSRTRLTAGTSYTVNINASPTKDELVVSYVGVTGTLYVYRASQVMDPAVSPGDIVTLVIPSGWDVPGMSYAQSGDEVYIAQKSKAPSVIKRYSNECWVLESIAFVDQPSEWGLPAPVAGYVVSGLVPDLNYPTRVAFHQQRLAFASTSLQRQTVWLSRAGDFTHFGVSSTLLESDAITFTLDSGTQDKIQWMISEKTLNIGTVGNEWTVSGATRTALTPTNILAQRQTNTGGEANMPLLVGSTVLFVEQFGRAVREFVYDINSEGYKTSDISVLSGHLTENSQIVDWAYQKTPNSIIWAVLDNGWMLGITYQRDHQVVAWHTHTTTRGSFKAVSSNPGSNREDEVWVITRRWHDGSLSHFLEKLHDEFKPVSTSASSPTVPSKSSPQLFWYDTANYLDSSIRRTGVASSTISGADHLEGETVSVFADGTMHPDVLITGGSATLNAEYSDVLVGHPIVAEVWPHTSDLPGPEGSGVGRMGRAVSLDLDLHNSLDFCVGKYTQDEGETSEEPVVFRDPDDITGAALPLFTGFKHVAAPEGHDRHPTYFIRQANAFPLTIRAVIDTVELNE
jgi:hypothetical protein